MARKVIFLRSCGSKLGSTFDDNMIIKMDMCLGHFEHMGLRGHFFGWCGILTRRNVSFKNLTLIFFWGGAILMRTNWVGQLLGWVGKFVS